MLHILNTIVPVFAVIALGLAARARGYLPEALIGPLNRIVYHLAIPAMIFKSIAGASFQAHFDPLLLAGTLVPVVIACVLALGMGLLLSVKKSEFGTFLQSSFHGNLGYIGLAVAYYFLTPEGFTRAVILAGFLMLLQNFLAVVCLQVFAQASHPGRRLGFVVRKIVINPIILSALAGILFSLSRVPLPAIIDRSLGIVSGMALPLALLVIGSSLSFRLLRAHLRQALGAGLVKLLLLPAAGFLMYGWLGMEAPGFLPGLVLLAAPTATITYVMAGEMKGSTQLASAAVSLNTLLSGPTFIFWLGLSV
jgi:predicted permease